MPTTFRPPSSQLFLISSKSSNVIDFVDLQRQIEIENSDKDKESSI